MKKIYKIDKKQGYIDDEVFLCYDSNVKKYLKSTSGRSYFQSEYEDKSFKRYKRRIQHNNTSKRKSILSIFGYKYFLKDSKI